MLGAIIGDIVGSRFEFNNHRSKDFELFDSKCFFTDDTVMTCAVATALVENKDVSATMRKFAKNYPGRGYGGSFANWIRDEKIGAYYSFGNGAAMRVSSVGWTARNEREVKEMSRKVTEVTHDHPEGLKGAEATAMCVFLAVNGADKNEIKRTMMSYYPEIAGFDYDELKRTYLFNETCQDTVPQAFYCFLISDNFEDCLRTSVSIGGDTDTLCAISCAIAEAYYGIPNHILNGALRFFSSFDKEFLLGDLVRIYEKNIDLNV